MRTLLKQPQPYYNHNGGHVLFADGNTLYFGLGDGGEVNDPHRYAQNPDTRLGKLLRARVTATGRSDWEVVATGLRNPWRFSYDAPSRELWIGDVGSLRSRRSTVSRSTGRGFRTSGGGRLRVADATRMAATH